MKTRRLYAYVLGSAAVVLVIIWLKTGSPKDSAESADSNASLSKDEYGSARRIPPVKIAVYYETLCPDSMAFIVKQLYPTYQKLGSIMTIDLVPYGKASYEKSADTWAFQCQHGQRECNGNTIHSCVINTYPDIGKSLPFVHCSMSQDPISSASQCAKDGGLDYQSIADCAGSNKGRSLLHDNGVRTESLKPKLHYVPWIVVNDVYSQEKMEIALENLKGVVCSTYTGPQPAECST